MFLYIQFCILSVSRLYISAQSVGSGTPLYEIYGIQEGALVSWSIG